MGGAKAAKLLIAVVDRGRGQRLVEVCRDVGLPLALLCMGHGTANSKVLEYLGLSETRKDVAFAFADSVRAREAMAKADERLGMSTPGHGILLCLALSGLSGAVHRALGCETATFEQQEEAMSVDGAAGGAACDLVVAVVRRGDAEVVMDAARGQGARGGTVVHARRSDVGGAESLFGVELDPEQDVVMIVCRHADKLPIMRAIGKVAGPSTDSRGIVLSLPVEDAVGLRPSDVSAEALDGMPDTRAADGEAERG